MSAILSQDEIIRYSRHLLIPEVGLAGQKKLKASSVLIVGTGGLGSPVGLYLAAAGIGNIGLIDFDKVELSNLQRQVIHSTSSIGRSKVESARDRMIDINPNITITTYDEPLSAQNGMRIAKDYQIVVDGSDNFATRYLTNDICVFLGIPNIFGSVYRFDGQASVFFAKEGPCYRCVFPEAPPDGLVPSCADGGVMGIIPGTIGSIQATETIKYLLGMELSLIGKLMIYDAIDMRFDYVKLRKDPACKVCGKNPTITTLSDSSNYCSTPELTNEYKNNNAIHPDELKVCLDKGIVTIIDVREEHELDISSISGAICIPLGQFSGRLPEIMKFSNIVTICRTGTRSMQAVNLLKAAGYRNARSLVGGINAWITAYDPDQPIY